MPKKLCVSGSSVGSAARSTPGKDEGRVVFLFLQQVHEAAVETDGNTCPMGYGPAKKVVHRAIVEGSAKEVDSKIGEKMISVDEVICTCGGKTNTHKILHLLNFL